MDRRAAMLRAVELARAGEGLVEPNPMVGCVIVRDGVVVGEGYHTKYGAAHAEVAALGAAGDRGGGATVVVTLEPCRHEGKTGPCTDALIAAGVGQVVMGSPDPSPVSGGGAERLRAAGIEVVENVCRAETDALIRPFVKRTLRGLPWVIAKWASTVDGATATASGDSQWISGEASRRVVHERRACADAIVVGVGTATADDPMLTARDVAVRRVARRVVIDPGLRLADGAKLWESIDEAPVTVAVGGGAPESRIDELEVRGVEIVTLPGWRGDGGPGGVLDVSVLMRHLVEKHDATNVMVEGGGRTIGEMWGQGVIDELMVFVGAKVLGDGAGSSAMRLGQGAASIEKMQRARAVRLEAVERVGDDVMMRWVKAGR